MKPIQWTIRILVLTSVMAMVALVQACQTKADSSRAPDFTLLNLNGDTVNLTNYKGKVILLNFFATYCPPCRMEIPDFVRLQEKYGSRGLIVIGISCDQNGERILPDFIRRLGINYPVLLATSKVLKDYGDIYALPVTFLIDRDLKILKQFTGMITQEDLEPFIQEALKHKA